MPRKYAEALKLADRFSWKLNYVVLTKARMEHQPRSTTKALRQVKHVDTVLMSQQVASQAIKPLQSEHVDDVRDVLLKRLSSLVSSSAHSITSGANRQIRHSGVFAVNHSQAGARARQKVVLQSVAASVRFNKNFVDRNTLTMVLNRLSWFAVQELLCLCRTYMKVSSMQTYLIYSPSGLATSLLCYASRTRKRFPKSSLVKVMANSSLKYRGPYIIQLVIALYTNSGTRGAKHESVPSVNSAGMPSYTMVRVYRPSHGSSYTSIACSSLGAATFIRVPSTHILFSFAASSGSIVRLDITTDAAHPFELITLCPLSSVVMQGLRTRVDQVSACVQALQRSKRLTSTVDIVSEESETSDMD